ncbi:3'-5' exonuclease [Deinococcus peraridilitoris]|uniref:DNA-directed DNA polymerase n=1 Tax=Deinococcus peraridilitoris (strain DSM 19664 / LMG 22246 / CIP 109416 / KR-200) TaxID=937777 RepID=L0A1Q2_DEIPD|nr:3'-5' exonuclease [Deinococcus peraridilitoris]AFZ66945.1 DNA polymerase elongation subunit (family B) [Deinococcus peraridilitoris DSM 19664]
MFSDRASSHLDPWLHGADPTPGIVSVHCDWSGLALVWRRDGTRVRLERTRFRPFVFARDLRDVEHLEEQLVADDPRAPVSFRQLRGPAGSLRFLIDAHDGRRLRRELLRGASRRLGRAVVSLHDLSGYSVLGPIEQYLVRTGRTYFKAMAFDDVHRLQFDLETTSLSPHDGRIFMVSVLDNRGCEVVLEAPHGQDEAPLIREFVRLIRERDPDVIENHNIMNFDLPFLMQRAEMHRIPLDIGRAGGPRGVWRVQDGRSRAHWTCAGREIVDTLDAARGHDTDAAGRGLKALARAYGLASEDRVYLDGAQIAETYRRDPDAVRRYALQDVQEVSRLAERLLAPYFALAQMTPRPYHRLPYAGTATGILEPMLVRAYLHEGHALPGAQASSGAAHQGGATYLFAEGVLPRVVKADIASLYPSLIRTHGIKPKSDSLGVFSHLVECLTRLRLEHKQAARDAPAGSRAAGEHLASQIAMKVVINSAYGYLGAGAMSIFGDPDAANEVTRLGRETLSCVLAALQSAGVTLIEADTDGVYFSVPPDWDETRERQLVQDVSALLPPLVNLEYEGRYRAMLSHQIKNYALLTEDGQLILRGASLRSSRAEAYAERFLEGAVRHLLEGNVEGVRREFDRTVQRLRARSLTCADVTTTVRVTKTPADYLKLRDVRKEAPYEALLNSGRRQWEVGDRVRFYRREDGLTVTLSDQDVRDYSVAHYLNVLNSYAERLATAFEPEVFEQLFRTAPQAGLFDRPLTGLLPAWRAVHCAKPHA